MFRILDGLLKELISGARVLFCFVGLLLYFLSALLIWLGASLSNEE